MRRETKATRATAIPRSVKLAVWHRDRESCVLCGHPVPEGCACAHIVRRSQGGRGIEQNIVTLCCRCHRELDGGILAKFYKKMVIQYISDLYPGWSEESVKYHKGGTL